MLNKFEGQVLVTRVDHREDQCEVEHVLAEQGHPGRAIGLFEVAARRQGGAPVEHADIVQAEKAALEQVAAGRVLAVEPPREVQEQLLESVAQEIRVPLSPLARPRREGEQRRPGMHGRVDITEVPLVRGDLPARVKVHVAEHQLDLPSGEAGIDHAQRHAMESQVPRRVPGVFPAVGHRQDVPVLHVEPLPGVSGHDPARSVGGQDRQLRGGLGRPGVAEPDVGQHVERRVSRTAVGHRDEGSKILGIGLGPFHLDVEVAIPGEHPGVE